MRKLRLRNSVCYLAVAMAAMAGAGHSIAGNVRASVSGGSLFLYGDSGANSLMLSSAEPGKILIADAGGSEVTTINGESEPIELSGWSGGIFAYLYDGNDFIQIESGHVRGAVHLDLGAGDDEVLIAAAEVEVPEEVLLDEAVPGEILIEQSLLILGGGGNDFVDMYGLTVKGQATLDLGNGNDELLIGDGVLDETGSSTSFQRSLVILPGAGEDIVGLWGADVALDLTIDDPNGAAIAEVELVDVGRNLFLFSTPQQDTLTLLDVTVNELTKIIAKDGIDDLLIDSLSSDRLEVYLGAGADTFEANLLDIGRMWLYLEGGNDSSQLTSSLVDRLTLYGAAGDDEMTITGVEGIEAFIYGEGGTDTLVEGGNNYATFRVYSVENR